jgi:hypothetical protein
MLVSGLILSAVGMFLFIRGKRAGDPAGVVGGLSLTLIPLFVHSLAVLWLVSAGITGGVVVLRRSGGAPMA